MTPTVQTPTPTPTATNLITQIAVAALCRLVLNTARRFVYPFAPALSRGMDVPVAAITSLIAVNQAASLLALPFGPLSDRWGHRTIMLLGVAMGAVGLLLIGIYPTIGLLAVALFTTGLGKSIFDPALHAYMGQHIPYEKRGLSVGIIETSWAGSSLIGMPVAGLLIASWGWQSPFLVMGGLSVLIFGVLWIMLPAGGGTLQTDSLAQNMRAAWGQLLRTRTAAGALIFAFFANAANDVLFVVYGLWLEDSFGLSIVSIGLTATVIGVAELLGEGLTATLADRIGLKRSVIISLILTGLAYALLPLIAQNLTWALVGLFILFVAFEFNIVTAMSLFTEVLPDARATMMSGYKASSGLGRMTGALIGVPIWLFGGMMATGTVSAAICGVALAGMVWGFRDWGRG